MFPSRFDSKNISTKVSCQNNQVPRFFELTFSELLLRIIQTRFEVERRRNEGLAKSQSAVHKALGVCPVIRS